MHLADYMKVNRLSDQEMALRIGCSRPTVSRLRRKLLRPEWATILKIEAETGGAVTANDFVELETAQ